MVETGPELQTFYRQARDLEPTDGEVARVLREVQNATRGPRALHRRISVALAFALAALALTAAAYPGARDALDDFFNGGRPPGTVVDAGSLPGWLRHGNALPTARPAAGSHRLLAEQDGQRLLAYRDARNGRACLVFGNDSDTCSDAGEWGRLFGDHVLLKLASGVGPTDDGKVAVFGLARSSVARVEVVDGGTLVASAPVKNGGWVIVANQGRHDELVGVDAMGKPLERLDARSWTWTFCTHEAGCS
jgi:hypothetical protein